MAKIIDITDKLNFEENPRLVIRGDEFEVNSDAKTMLDIMGILKNKENDVAAIIKVYEKLFGENERKKIEELKISFKDLTIIIVEAMKLIQGEEDTGE